MLLWQKKTCHMSLSLSCDWPIVKSVDRVCVCVCVPNEVCPSCVHHRLWPLLRIFSSHVVTSLSVQQWREEKKNQDVSYGFSQKCVVTSDFVYHVFFLFWLSATQCDSAPSQQSLTQMSHQGPAEWNVSSIFNFAWAGAMPCNCSLEGKCGRVSPTSSPTTSPPL